MLKVYLLRILKKGSIEKQKGILYIFNLKSILYVK